MRKLVIRPMAEVDIDAAADHYASEENIELALRSYGAVDQSLEMLLEQRSKSV